jgi:hypothetical protein
MKAIKNKIQADKSLENTEEPLIDTQTIKRRRNI